MTRSRARRTVGVSLRVLLAVAMATVFAASGASVASAGGKASSGSSISVVLLDSTDGVAHYGQNVTFAVSTSTAKPMVELNCYQNSVHVYWASAGFYDGYPWPWNQIFMLASTNWTSGAADCTARLYAMGKNGRTITLATTSFPVAA